MRVCFFGTYNRGHSANRIYASAVREAGYELVEIHEPLWEHTRDKDAHYFSPLGLLANGLRWLRAAWRLARRWSTSGGAPVALIGFNGQLDIVLLRLLCPRYGPRIVFAPLVSLTETLVDDRAVYRRDSLAARLLAWLDRLSCRLADVVVVDSHAHRRYFVERLGIDPARVSVCHLGVDNEMFSGRASATGRPSSARDGKTEVLYVGQYLPLHGLDVVVDAVGRLSRRSDLRFVFVGTGEERARIEPLLRATRADVEFSNWVPYEDLAARMAAADIVLGVFGASAKARIVVPNKVYEAAAVGAPIVTGDFDAVREVFEKEVHAVLCAADGASLAAAIARLADDPELRGRIGREARAMMAERFSPAALARAWSGPLGGFAPAFARASVESPRVGVAVLHYEDVGATGRCLASVAASDHENLAVLVVDNGSPPTEAAALRRIVGGSRSTELLALPSNRGYAGGNNVALERLFAGGCDCVLVLNNDTIVTPSAITMLARCARAHPSAGPIGPRVARDWPGGRAASLGERYWAWLAWMPRSLLRHRRQRQQSYPVGGILGCAFLVSRALYERLGGFEEAYFAYYDEVDYCLRARAMGMQPRVEPAAEIAHAGHRGFGGGFSCAAAYLKARNLWLLGRRRVGAVGWLPFAPGYFAMLGASAFAYLVRGRLDIIAAMGRGMTAAFEGASGTPPPTIFDGRAAPLEAEGPTDGSFP